MSHSAMAAAAGPRKLRTTAIAVLAAALMAGCAKRDHVEVGAIPDDYRTNHPITIAEKEQSIDLPVGASERGITETQRIALEGFISDYDRSASPVVTILVPSGSANEVAAGAAAADMTHVLRRNGVPDHRIMRAAYAAQAPEASAPIRVSYVAVKASTGKCGRWSDDLLNNAENKHYANFGCSYQNNLAAQIANPADLLGPRKSSPIDAENRDGAITQYKRRLIAEEFSGNSEIEY